MSRTKILRLGLFAAMGVILVRLFFIQILHHQDYVAKAAEQQTMQNTIVAKRGEIYAMDEGEAVSIVMNEPVWTVLVDPSIMDEEGVRGVLGDLKKYKVSSAEEVFSHKDLRYFVIAKNVPRRTAEKIKEKEVTGIWFSETVRRVYPEGKLMSRTLGFVNAEGVGQYGVEGALNTELSGKNGLLKTVKDVNNIPLTIGDDNVRVPAEDGKNIVLSVERNYQAALEKALKKGMKRSVTTHAAGLIMDPNNGQILAMANLPNYDPANFGAVSDVSAYTNYTTEDAYEPASVCKTFTFAAAIEEGVMNAKTTYNNRGSLTIDGWKIKNAYQGQYGTITMQTALDYSLNTGSMTALMLLGGNSSEITQTGKDKLYQYYHDKFGFGELTGVELLETAGIVVPSDEVDGTNARYANMTFGQSMNISMLQTAAAFSAVVNGGKYYQPTIVAGEMKGGEFVQTEPAAAKRTVVSEETSRQMREMLYGVRRSQRVYKIDKDGYYIGGKTGTAQAIKNGKYIMNETGATYIGFLASGSSENKPKYVIMVRIWEDGRKIEGEADALPIFNDVKAAMLKLTRMKPNESE